MPTPLCWLTATQCNTLQHLVTRCNALQHATTRCHTLEHCTAVQRTATHCNAQTHCNTLDTQMHCNTLQHTDALQHTATHRCTATHDNTLGTQTRCNTLDAQTHCNTLKAQTGGCSKHHRGFRAFATGPLRLAVCRNIFSYLCGCNMAVLMRVWHACIHTHVTHMYSFACCCRIHVCDMTHFVYLWPFSPLHVGHAALVASHIWHALRHIYDMLCLYVQTTLFILVKCRFHICEMPLSYVRNAAFIYVMCLLVKDSKYGVASMAKTYNRTSKLTLTLIHTHTRAHTHKRTHIHTHTHTLSLSHTHTNTVCMTWLIHTCDMSCLYVPNTFYICAAYYFHICEMSDA